MHPHGRQAVALRTRAEARVREAEQNAADLEARAGISRQRVAILERELEEAAEPRRQLAAAQQALQVRVLGASCIWRRLRLHQG